MKMSFNGQFITVNELPKVKSDMKEFKARYTDGDLKTFGYNAIQEKYQKLTGKSIPWTTDIIKASVEAFGTDFDGNTLFRVVLLLDGWSEIVEMSYHTNLDLKVDNEPHWEKFKGQYMYTFSIVTFERNTEDDRILYSEIAV